MTDEALIDELARTVYNACHQHCFDGVDAHPEDAYWQSFRTEARAILPIIQRERLAAGEAVKREAKEVIITGLGLTNTRMLEKMRALNVEAIVGGGEWKP